MCQKGEKSNFLTTTEDSESLVGECLVVECFCLKPATHAISLVALMTSKKVWPMSLQRQPNTTYPAQFDQADKYIISGKVTEPLSMTTTPLKKICVIWLNELILTISELKGVTSQEMTKNMILDLNHPQCDSGAGVLNLLWINAPQVKYMLEEYRHQQLYIDRFNC